MQPTAIQHYPMSMERFGVNPFGEPLYRIVLSNSRLMLVSFEEGELSAPKWVPAYPWFMDRWVLERWMDTFSYCRKTREQWERGPEAALGPYPARGEYVPAGGGALNPDDLDVSRLIAMVEASTNMPWQEVLAACQLVAEKKDKDYDTMAEARIRNAFPAFSDAYSTGTGGGAAKTSSVLKSANELGLPIPSAKPKAGIVNSPMVG